jgi:aryl-alcohol dehydrogenase-like predicted oxidoreductase
MTNLILGTVQMGLDYGVNNNSGKISFEKSCEILNKAFELGIETLDTAKAYGNAHQVIGEFHQLFPNVKFKIITKIPHDVDFSTVKITIKEYIKDLNVDILEVLMFHSFDSYLKHREELYNLVELQSENLIKFIGVSVYTNEQIEAVLSDEHIDVVQLPYNLLDNESKRGNLLSKLNESKKIIHTRSAFLQGLFFKDISDKNLIVQSLKDELGNLNKIATEADVTMTELALSYCMENLNIDKVLIGVDSVEQLIANVKASEFELSAETLAEIDKISVRNLDLLNPSLWK